MTKAKRYIICIPIIIGFLGSFCLGLRWENGKLENGFPYTDKREVNKCDENSTDLGNCTSIKESDETIIVRLLEVFGLDYSTDKSKDLKFIDYAKSIMNLALSLVAFIALIISIYTFYMVIFSDSEAGAKKAKGNMVGIFIALGVIGLARLIVSVIFRRYQKHRLGQQENLPTINAEIIDENRS